MFTAETQRTQRNSLTKTINHFVIFAFLWEVTFLMYGHYLATIHKTPYHLKDAKFAKIFLYEKTVK